MTRMVTSITEKVGRCNTDGHCGFLQNYVEFLRSKCDPIEVDDARFTRMEKAAYCNLPLGWTDFLDTPITEVNMKAVVNKGASKKAL